MKNRFLYFTFVLVTLLLVPWRAMPAETEKATPGKIRVLVFTGGHEF